MPVTRQGIKGRRPAFGDEKGIGLVETLIAVAIVGTAVLAILSGLSTGSRAISITEKQVAAESLARSQLEYTKKLSYLTAPASYNTITPPSADYSIQADASAIAGADENIQKVTITIYRGGEALLVVEDYKVNRQ